MHVPVEWLRELAHVDPGVTGADVAAALVEVGLEEEGLHTSGVSGPLVVGRVIEKHPEPQKNGKTVNWCLVDVGDANGTGEPQGVVCGAHNFDAGDLVAVVLPGGVLPTPAGPLEVTARRTYGHVSAGMICSERELGLGDDHAGILVLTDRFAGDDDALAALVPGADAIPLLGLDEEVVEVNVTPDRGYCFSMRGIAREYALATRTAYADPADLLVPAPNDGGYAVRLADDAPLDGRPGCDRYVARVVRDVDVHAASPRWMQARLTAVGMRPISLAVDVTNYVMMLLGQPLHAFDLETLSGEIVVRRARAGETLRTLDDVDRRLDPEDLLITDGGETVLAFAGVMGGESSEVTGRTRQVLIEAAHFDPVTVARTSRRHRLVTEASKRFERGVDPGVTDRAAQLAADLLAELGGGTVDPGVTDVGGVAPRAPIPFDAGMPSRYVGLDYPREEVVATLRAIGCEVTSSAVESAGESAVESAGESGPTLTVVPPTWRPDLVDGPDLVEEVARVRGYSAIPSVLPAATGGRGLTHGQRVRRLVAVTLAQQGLVEVLSYPFVAPALFDQLGYAADDPRRRAVRLANPLQDDAPLMRTSVLDTLLETLRRNVSRGARDVALYEVGLVTEGRDGDHRVPVPPVDGRPDDATVAALLEAVPRQPRHVALAAAGDAVPAGPWGPARRHDATDVVAWASELCQALGLRARVTAAQRAPFHPGRCAEVRLDGGAVVGHVGELHPKVVAALGLPPRTVAGELDVDVLEAATGTPVQAQPLSAYPPALTDVALVVEEAVPAAEVEEALRAGAGERLESVALFDLYRGDQVGEGRKSLAYRLVFRAPDRTLTTDEVSGLRDAAARRAAEAVGAVQRT
jgi:phenylalanyl-tRNA synthetase beta chain